MAALFTLFFVALAGLPLGEWTEVRVVDRTNLERPQSREADQNSPRHPRLLTSLPWGGSWAGERGSPSSVTLHLVLSPGPGMPRLCLQWRQLLQPHALPSHS